MTRLRTVLLSAIAVVAAGALACVATNEDHCNFRGGDEYCANNHGERRFCSVCVAEFDGCAQAAPEASCLPHGSSSASAVTTDDDPSNSTAPTGGQTSTGSGSTTSTGSTTIASTATTTSTTSTTTTSATGSTSPQTTGSTSPQTTGSTSDTDGPICGDGEINGGEVCDGANLNGNNCTNFPPWTGGALACGDDCLSYDLTGCCLGEGSACEVLDDNCCAGFSCGLDATCN